MKVTVDIDCTPEEARRFLGLPDLGPVHEAYLAKLQTLVGEGVTPDTLTDMVKSWAPMGDAGMAMWTKLLSPSAAK